jgi:hypothetical protein
MILIILFLLLPVSPRSQRSSSSPPAHVLLTSIRVVVVVFFFLLLFHAMRDLITPTRFATQREILTHWDAFLFAFVFSPSRREKQEPAQKDVFMGFDVIIAKFQIGHSIHRRARRRPPPAASSRSSIETPVLISENQSSTQPSSSY